MSASTSIIIAAGRWTAVKWYASVLWAQWWSWWLGSIVGEDLVGGVAVADPVEVVSPDVGVDNRKGPAVCGNFAKEGVVVGLSVRAVMGCREDWLEAGRGDGLVKGDR